LGGGGMAEVSSADDRRRRLLAPGRDQARLAEASRTIRPFAQMFIAEAQISSRLVHPNIVSVVDFDRDAEHRLFLVMSSSR